MTILVKLLGALAVVTAIIGLWMTIFSGLSGPGGQIALVSMFVMQLIIGVFLIYGAHLKNIGSDLAQKVYPPSIAASILFVAFAYRWFTHNV